MDIYYFTGTGNSLYAAKRISEIVEGKGGVSLTQYNTKEKVELDGGEAAIVTPLHFYGLPQITKNFLSKINPNGMNYLSMVITAEYPDGIAINQARELLIGNGCTLNSAFYMKMPTNYILSSKMLGKEQIENLLKEADRQLEKIGIIIKSRQNFLQKESSIYNFFMRAKKSHAQWENDLKTFDRDFTINNKCNECGLCGRSCPIGNIRCDPKPVWLQGCTGCLRCINICPQEAIQYLNKTEGKLRYINPRISKKEFLERQKIE